jgi:anti-sigma B factor antagonist
MDYDFISSFDFEKNAWEVVISGEVDIFNSHKLKTGLTELILETPANIHIDCHNLEYIDSTALGALVAVLKNVRTFDGKVILKKIRPNIAKIFKITNLDKVFVIDDMLDDVNNKIGGDGDE